MAELYSLGFMVQGLGFSDVDSDGALPPLIGFGSWEIAARVEFLLGFLGSTPVGQASFGADACTANGQVDEAFLRSWSRRQQGGTTL